MKQVSSRDTKSDKQTVLGYINFSSGQRDPLFFSALDRLFIERDAQEKAKQPQATLATSTAENSAAERFPKTRQLLAMLEQHLIELSQTQEAFREIDRGVRTLRFVRDTFLDVYAQFHRDLLYGCSETDIFNSFLLAKLFELVLSRGEFADDFIPAESIDETKLAAEILRSFNDLIGYRPVSVLEGRERHEPNAHEWVASVPLYIRGVGTAAGKYQKLIDAALKILENVDRDIINDSGFDATHLQEIVLDPREYDFDHPVNRRPNYHFGYWDPHAIDNKGYYTRYVVHGVLWECALARVETAYMGASSVSHVPAEELMYEMGAVILGTMLMGSGITGCSPQAYDSSTTFDVLIPIIADYRDRFYAQLLERTPQPMKTRLQEEAEKLFQPFGGARQDINKLLAKRRADQLQRLHLARTYARMGYFQAAREQAEIVSVASARIFCQLDCFITEAHFLIDRNQLIEAMQIPPQLEDLLQRGIQCGALVDPWTILGFGAQFSLFPFGENSIHDHRVDDLINIMDDVFDLYSRLLKHAAATGEHDLQADLSDQMSDLASWWDKYGVTEVSNIEGFSGQAAWESAAKVATALAAWNKAGTATGDIAFWSRHVERFSSPKAFVLLAEALLEHRDLVATMGLLMYWLSHAETIPLTEANYSFHTIVLRWFEQLWHQSDEKENPKSKTAASKAESKTTPISYEERWKLTTKFFDFLEANADIYGQVPSIELGDEFFDLSDLPKKKSRPRGKSPSPKPNPHDETFDPFAAGLDNEFSEDSARARRTGSDPLYDAAYENMTFQDSADDGIDDELLEVPGANFGDDEDFELIHETERISERIAFLVTASKAWRFSAMRAPLIIPIGAPNSEETIHLIGDSAERIEEWLKQAGNYWHGLQGLLDKVSRYQVPIPRGTAESLAMYDRHRGTKEILMDRIIWTMVEMADAILILQGTLGKVDVSITGKTWEKSVCRTLSEIFRQRATAARNQWKKMLPVLGNESLLYIPTARGGSASEIVACRALQQAVLRLFEFAPRLGLITETFSLLSLVEDMERTSSLRPGAITEYDRLVDAATRAITTSVTESSKGWRLRRAVGEISPDEALVDYLERFVEILLEAWLSHSRQIRISPLESVNDRNYWQETKDFIQKYGADIFTQQFMAFGNLRAVLHQGVETYLRQLMQIRGEGDDDGVAIKLLGDLSAGKVSLPNTVAHLELIFEAVAENYTEYIDYNSTTTHSDHGEKLYMLLDMLRVLAGYERISWNLKPVYWVHETLVRCEQHIAASLWEKAVANRSVTAADEHLRRYQRLSTKYGLWIPSIHERLQERFVRPLQITRACGMVPTAIREARLPQCEQKVFEEFSRQIELFAMSPAGVGYELPEWLAELQEEAMNTRIDNKTGEDMSHAFEIAPPFKPVRLSRTELDKILHQLTRTT